MNKLRKLGTQQKPLRRCNVIGRGFCLHSILSLLPFFLFEEEEDGEDAADWDPEERREVTSVEILLE